MTIALRHPRFGRLLAALAASQAGDWLYNLALLAYVQERTHSTTWLAATTAARVAPVVALGPLGGVLADRVDRRRLMLATDVVRAVLMGLLALVALVGLPLVLAPLLAMLATVASAPHPPAVAATTPRLVPEADLAAANAARAVITPASIVLGPALGAALLLVGPPSACFALNALTFVLSAALIASLGRGPEFAPPVAEDRAGTPTVLADLRAGARELGRRREALRLVGADIACSAVYGAQTVLLVLAAGRLGLGAAGYGYLLAAVGLGGVGGAALAGRVRRRPATVAVGLAAVAVALVALAAAPALPVALAAAALSGAGSLVVEVEVETGLQRLLAADVLARAYGFAFPAAIGGIVAGSLAAPLLVGALGERGAEGLLAAAVGAVAMLLAPRPTVRSARAGARGPRLRRAS